MGIPHYLAMTRAELARNPPHENTAWLACHFSPYGCGLSNLPTQLPPGSLLVLDDSTPPTSHDPETVVRQLVQQAQMLECTGILLDLQRPDCPQAREMAAYLAHTLDCPVGVSHLYAEGLNCPVFLPPVPLDCSLENHVRPWAGREIWLETALEAQVLTLTKEGCTASPAPEILELGFAEERLHCHYAVKTETDRARFTLWRTREDIGQLLARAEVLGVTLAVGLWQELHIPLLGEGGQA